MKKNKKEEKKGILKNNIKVHQYGSCLAFWRCSISSENWIFQEFRGSNAGLSEIFNN